MLIDIKLTHPNAVTPSYSFSSDGAVDLTAVSMSYNIDSATITSITYDTGISLAIPNGYVGLLFPRSSIIKQGLRLSNGVGVIDSSFRGTIKLVFDRLNHNDQIYQIGDRIGQLMIIPRPNITFREVETLTHTDRNEGGFGSTGL